MATELKRVFIAFAAPDVRFRDLLRRLAIDEAAPIEFVDMAEAYDSAWKTRTRVRVKQCRGVVALLSHNSPQDESQLWEIRCAADERKPVIGVYLDQREWARPEMMRRIPCIDWSWEGIANFVRDL